MTADNVVTMPGQGDGDMDLLVESQAERARHAGRTDVLDKVKALTLLPDDMHADTSGVADYYEVGRKTIESLVYDHRDELESNGYRIARGQELSSLKKESGHAIPQSTPVLGLFPRRAILNVGMLLTASPIAKQVRNYLLDVEAVARESGGADYMAALMRMVESNNQLAQSNQWITEKYAQLVEKMFDGQPPQTIPAVPAVEGGQDRPRRLKRHRSPNLDRETRVRVGKIAREYGTGQTGRDVCETELGRRYSQAVLSRCKRELQTENTGSRRVDLVKEFNQEDGRENGQGDVSTLRENLGFRGSVARFMEDRGITEARAKNVVQSKNFHGRTNPGNKYSKDSFIFRADGLEVKTTQSGLVYWVERKSA